MRRYGSSHKKCINKNCEMPNSYNYGLRYQKMA